MKLIGGIQGNKVQTLDLDVNPRVGLILYPFENFNVKALYSQAFRAPSMNELSLHNPPGLSGNPELDPEKVNTFDLGMNYQFERAQIGANVYHSKQTGIIVQDRSNPELGGVYRNMGEVTFNGLEFEGKYYVTEALFLEGSMLYQWNKDKNDNENVTPVPNIGAKGGISYRAYGLTASLFDVFEGALDKKYDSKLNVSPIEPYNLISLHCSYDLSMLFAKNGDQNVSLQLQIDNLLDQEIWLPNWGMVPGSGMPVEQGRTVYFGMKLGL